MYRTHGSRISSALLDRADRHAAIAAAVALGAVASAEGAIVTWNCNLVIPDTSAGMYIDIAAQTSSTDPSSVIGWNLNPYSISPGTLVFSCGTGTDYVLNPAGDSVLNLAVGTVVGPASNLSNASTLDVFGSGSSSGWLLGATNYFGFSFNDGVGLRYGYGVMQVGATADTRTLLSLHYEDSGASITVVSAVPAPAAIALLGVAGLSRARRRS